MRSWRQAAEDQAAAESDQVDPIDVPSSYVGAPLSAVTDGMGLGAVPLIAVPIDDGADDEPVAPTPPAPQTFLPTPIYIAPPAPTPPQPQPDHRPAIIGGILAGIGGGLLGVLMAQRTEADPVLAGVSGAALGAPLGAALGSLAGRLRGMPPGRSA